MGLRFVGKTVRNTVVSESVVDLNKMFFWGNCF